MNLEYALSFFDLSETYTLNDLNSRFKVLVKKFHPDKNMENQDWSHQMMIELNECYQILLNNYEILSRRIEEQDDENVPQDNETDPSFPYFFNQALELFFNGCCLFYEYGLENPHLRTEGVRRFRFRESVRIIQKSIEFILKINELILSPEDSYIFDNVKKFILLFYNDIKKKPVQITSLQLNLAFDNSSKLLAQLIKSSLAPDWDKSRKKLPKPTHEMLYYCYISLFNLMKKTNSEKDKNEIMFKISLLDSYISFLEITKKGLLEYYL